MGRDLIFLFPGQSSRDRQMFDRARTTISGAFSDPEEVFVDVTGRGPDLEFSSSLDIQLSVTLINLAYLRLLKGAGLDPAASAGMSLGEYTHLVAINALSEDEVLKLVTARGHAYDGGPSGMMVAVQPADIDDVRAAIETVRRSGGWGAADLAISNENSARQCVVAGARDAVEAFVVEAEETLFVQCAVIEDRIPMHTGRFAPAMALLRPALEAANWQQPHQHYWPNVVGKAMAAPSPADFIDVLCRHVSEPVLWRQTIDALDARHPDAIYVEVGPRTVLRDLMTRRWIDKARVVSLDADGGPRVAMDRLAALAA